MRVYQYIQKQKLTLGSLGRRVVCIRLNPSLESEGGLSGIAMRTLYCEPFLGDKVLETDGRAPLVTKALYKTM